MRLWSLHPAYLDAQGLVALWREGLLARKVLLRRTKGYRDHPQLERFKAQPDPVAAIDTYLLGVFKEAKRRGYHFDRNKLAGHAFRKKIGVTDGQLRYEMDHLRKKLKKRAPEALKKNILDRQERQLCQTSRRSEAAAFSCSTRGTPPPCSSKLPDLEREKTPRPHPLFKIRHGGIASWEKIC